MRSLSIILLALIFVAKSYSSCAQYKTFQDSLNFFHKRQDLTKTLFYCDKIIALQPHSTTYILYKGSFLHETKNYSEAITEFSKALTINPNIADAYVRRGRSYLGLQLYDSSIKDFNKAYGKYRYQDSAIFLYRSHAYLRKGDHNSAIADYDSAIRFASSEKEFLCSRALVKIEMGDLEDALKDLDSSVALDKNFLTGIKERALVNYRLGNNEASLYDAQTYLRKTPDDDQLILTVAALYYRMKDFKTTLQYLNKCECKVKTKEVYQLIGMTNYYLVNDQQAINDLTLALRLNPTQAEEAELYYFIGVCKNNLKPKSGCSEISKAIEKGLTAAKKMYLEECK